MENERCQNAAYAYILKVLLDILGPQLIYAICSVY